MAKVFKILAYVVDPVDEFDESSLEDCLIYCTQNDISLSHINIDGTDIGEWDDDLPVNYTNCSIEEFEKYFKKPLKII